MCDKNRLNNSRKTFRIIKNRAIIKHITIGKREVLYLTGACGTPEGSLSGAGQFRERSER
jgi:hypothetical protein